MDNLQAVNQILGDSGTQDTSSLDAVNQILGGDSNGDSGSPQDVTSSMQQTGSQDFNGNCQKFVEQMVYGHAGIFPSAIDAWSAYAKAGQGKTDLENAKPGDLLYFSPNESNQGYGHTGIYLGNNQFVSATDNGVMPNDLTKWQQQTGQSILGYVPTKESK